MAKYVLYIIKYSFNIKHLKLDKMNKKTPYSNFFSSFTAKCILILLFITTTVTAQTIVEQHGRLRVNGNRIVDKTGAETSLAGNSLFWSIAYDANQSNRELTNFYKAEVVDYLAQNWKSSIIRVAMGVKETWDSGRGYISDPEGQKAKIKVVIDAAIASGIYVIIDWHSHDAELYQDEAIAFFTEMAELYGDKDNVIYEIYNEPIRQTWSQVKSYSVNVINAIRAVDPDNLIIVGSPTWSQDVDVASQDPINDVNTAYTLHFYSGTHKQPLRDKAIIAMNNGIALFATEWGSVDADGNGNVDIDETLLWMDFLKDNGISHVNWAISDKNEGSATLEKLSGIEGLINNQLTDAGLLIKDIVINWCTTNSTAPRVSIRTPDNQRTFQAGEDIELTVNATDSNGTIDTVEIFNGNQILGTDTVAPYIFVINDLEPGDYGIKAKVTDNDGETTSTTFNVTVTDASSGGSCNFNTPIATSLPTFDNVTYNNIYKIGENGPNINTIRSFDINWNLEQNGLYSFALNTTNGDPAYYLDLKNKLAFNFASANPEVTISNSGMANLDGSYWVNQHEGNFVMVSKTDSFTLYFSNSMTPPECGNETLSLIDLEKEKIAIKMYPNPVNELLNIVRLPNTGAGIQIVDMQGKTVMTSTTNTNQAIVNTSSLEDGVYVVIITTNKFKKSILLAKK